jgi:hypothetical protein
MSMEPWFNEHENWVEELKEFLAAHLDDDEMEALSDEDLMFISNLAARLRRGDITIQRSFDEVHKWIAQRMGFAQYHNRETFDLEVAYGDMIDITEALKENLGVVDQVGIADAILVAYISPNVEIDDKGRLYSPDRSSGMAFQCKGWFDINGTHPAERKDLNWAIVTAVRNHVEA